MGALYAMAKAGTITPETSVYHGSTWADANSYAELKALFDVYYWHYAGGGASTPQTLKQLYGLAKSGTVKWDTDVKGPGWVAEKHADKITELLPVLKCWFYEDPATQGPFSRAEMHSKFLLNSFNSDTTDVTGEPTDNNWDKAKEWKDVAGKFNNYTPRHFEFWFCPVSSEAQIEASFNHFAQEVSEHFCRMVGLSIDPSEAEHYEKADAYKELVRAAVKDDAWW